MICLFLSISDCDFLLFLAELIFADAAKRASEIFRQIFPLGPCFDSVIRIAQVFIIGIAAYSAYIFHNASSF